MTAMEHEYTVGTVGRMKKAHPCGSAEWKITRTGADFGLQCCGCGHHVMIPRAKFLKAVRGVVKQAGEV